MGFKFSIKGNNVFKNMKELVFATLVLKLEIQISASAKSLNSKDIRDISFSRLTASP